MLRGEIRLLPQLWGTVRQLLILDGPAHEGKDPIWPVSYVPENCWLTGITLKDHLYIIFFNIILLSCNELKLNCGSALMTLAVIYTEANSEGDSGALLRAATAWNL